MGFGCEQARCSDNESGVHSAVETQMLSAAHHVTVDAAAVAADVAVSVYDDVVVLHRHSLPVRVSSSLSSSPVRRKGAVCFSHFANAIVAAFRLCSDEGRRKTCGFSRRHVLCFVHTVCAAC